MSNDKAPLPDDVEAALGEPIGELMKQYHAKLLELYDAGYAEIAKDPDDWGLSVECFHDNPKYLRKEIHEAIVNAVRAHITAQAAKIADLKADAEAWRLTCKMYVAVADDAKDKIGAMEAKCRIVDEWIRGCSCAPVGKPWECRECTESMAKALAPPAEPAEEIDARMYGNLARAMLTPQDYRSLSHWGLHDV